MSTKILPQLSQLLIWQMVILETSVLSVVCLMVSSSFLLLSWFFYAEALMDNAGTDALGQVWERIRELRRQ